MSPSAVPASNVRFKLPVEGLNMRRNKFSALVAIAALAAFLLLGACSVNVKKEANGQDKQVDIHTLVGGVHVSQQADVSDVGLTVYPGARLKDKDSSGDKSANVNISGFGYGIKVVALQYESADTPAKVISFYRNQLKKYGTVLECHTSSLHLDMNTESRGSKSDSNELTCEGDHGMNVELKVGKKDDQHIVAVESEGEGSSFSLVYVRTHGKGSDI
jgi:ABC-type oligopeptide transport system substrate-binding subunit